MKKFIYALAITFGIYGCKSVTPPVPPEQPVIATLDLMNIEEDKVQVSVDPES